MRGAVTPAANCSSATARSTTLTYCTPPLNSFLNSCWSCLLTSILRAGRAIPKYASEHFRSAKCFVINSSHGQRPSASRLAAVYAAKSVFVKKCRAT